MPLQVASYTRLAFLIVHSGVKNPEDSFFLSRDEAYLCSILHIYADGHSTCSIYVCLFLFSRPDVQNQHYQPLRTSARRPAPGQVRGVAPAVWPPSRERTSTTRASGPAWSASLLGRSMEVACI